MGLYGVRGRIAWVDLGSRQIRYEEPPEAVYTGYLGGYGIGAYYLYHRQRAGVDALGEEAAIGFLAGPLTGTPAITGNRFTVVGKSPKTGGWGDANCGGKFGPALKKAGLDAIFVSGISTQPVYLLVEDARVSIRDAREYWGRLVSDSESRLRKAHGPKSQAAVIGPAGEKVHALAAVMNDEGRAAARSGLGMVMGSKRLKAVVAVGTGSVPLAQEGEFKSLRAQLLRTHCSAENPAWAEYHKYGTNAAFEFLVEEGDTPTRNYGGVAADFPSPENLGGDAVESLIVKRYACWSCPIACGAYVEVPDGPFGGRGHKPEYETISCFGPNCMNNDLESICRINNICNEYGMDTMSTGMTVSFAMECYENGLITKGDLGGLDLTWGNHQAMVTLVEQMADGDGFAGEVLSDGVRRAVERIGPQADQYAMDCGGEELSQHDPRCYPGIAASGVVDATPGRHTQAGSWFAESFYVPVDSGDLDVKKYEYGGKGEIAKHMSNLYHTINMAGLCHFSVLFVPSAEIPRYLTLAMGTPFTMADVLEVGERAANLRIAFNLREGIRNVTSYKMPPRTLGEPPLEAGATAGVSVDNARQIRDYYVAAGWNPETGVPRKSVFERLGLDFALDVAEDG